MSNDTPKQPQEQELRVKVIHAICFKPGVSGHIKQFEAVERLIAINRLEARLDEQMDTGTLRYKPDKDGNYGAVYYYIPGKDTVMPQEQRKADLQKQLDTLKGEV